MAPPKKPWFRFYTEAPMDRKLRRLKPEYRWLFVCTLGMARMAPTEGEQNGELWLSAGVAATEQDLWDYAGMSPQSVKAGLAALTEVGVLHWNAESSVWVVTRWSERQHESDHSTSRSQKHRSKAVVATPKQRPINGDATRQRQKTEAETYTEAEEPIASQPSSAALAVVAPLPPAVVKTRPSNPLWDAVMAVTGTDTASIPEKQLTKYGMVVSQLKKAGATADDVRARADVYKRRFPQATLTPTALLNRWAEIAPGVGDGAARSTISDGLTDALAFLDEVDAGTRTSYVDVVSRPA